MDYLLRLVQDAGHLLVRASAIDDEGGHGPLVIAEPSARKGPFQCLPADQHLLDRFGQQRHAAIGILIRRGGPRSAQGGIHRETMRHRHQTDPHRSVGLIGPIGPIGLMRESDEDFFGHVCGVTRATDEPGTSVHRGRMLRVHQAERSKSLCGGWQHRMNGPRICGSAYFGGELRLPVMECAVVHRRMKQFRPTIRRFVATGRDRDHVDLRIGPQ